MPDFRTATARGAAPQDLGSLAPDALNALTAHIAVLDETGAILVTNHAWRQFADRNGSTWPGVSEGINYLAVCDAVDDAGREDAGAVAAGIRDVLAGRMSEFTLEYPCHSPGEQRWFVARVTRFRTTGTVRVVVSHEDITDRRAAETAKLKAQQRFERLFDLSPEAMVMTDGPGRILLVNRRAEQVFGYQRRDMLGKSIDLLLPTASWVGHQELRDIFAAAGVPRPMETGLSPLGCRKDGTEFPVEVSLSTLDVDGGIAVVAAIRDLSERLQLETHLRESQKMETIGRLAGGVAHDFNNLISVINATAELAQQGLPDGDPLRADLETIRFAGGRAAALTQQLLALGRQQVLEPTILVLDSVIAQMQPLLEHLAGSSIDISVHSTPTLWPVRADRTQLEQIVLNLVVNARDAMSSGGSLTVKTANVALDEGYTKVRPDVSPGRYVSLSVTDTGTGMDSATMERMFEPFFTTKGAGKGTGLGLSTVYGIVKQGGGDITCTSELGHGTTFTIYFPSSEGNAAVASVGPSASPRGEEAILVIEDDEALRSVTGRILQRNGYTVVPAANGTDALQLLQYAARPFDLVMTDLVMPGLNGAKVAERIAALHPATTILFTSGYSGSDQALKGLEGRTNFIAKPYSIAELTQKVRELLDSKSDISCGRHRND